MSASASDPPGGNPDATASAPFVERDDRETLMPYDKGGVPLYLALLWVGFIASYIGIMATLALPDLRAWMAR